MKLEEAERSEEQEKEESLLQVWAQAKVSIKTLTETARVHTRHKEVLEGS